MRTTELACLRCVACDCFSVERTLQAQLSKMEKLPTNVWTFNAAASLEKALHEVKAAHAGLRELDGLETAAGR